MDVTEIECYGRTASGVPLGGRCTFSDGKEWKWHWSQYTKDYYFAINSGVPSQLSVMNYERLVAYPKRIAALVKKLKEIGEHYEIL